MVGFIKLREYNRLNTDLNFSNGFIIEVEPQSFKNNEGRVYLTLPSLSIYLDDMMLKS
jgi:hypothetical protein